jgi:HD-like signal output (HDOD) protein
MSALPLPDLAAWTNHLRALPVPVLGASAEALAALSRLEDETSNVDAHRIGEAVVDDPLATLHILALAAHHRHARQITAAETVTASVLMLGIGPFFRACAQLGTVEALLADRPQALAGLHTVLARAHRAGRFALAFAVHRMEGDAELLRQAALLHDFAELLLWCHAPALAQQIAARQAADPTLRSEAVQREVLNVGLGELEQALMRTWHLPERLIRLTDDHADGHALVQTQVRLVKLAVQLSRHTATSWNNAALPDDIDEIAQLLNLSVTATQRLLLHIDA